MSNWFDEALKMKNDGKQMPEIASELGLHYDTVRKKFKRYYRKQMEEVDEPEEVLDPIEEYIMKSAKKGVLAYEVADKYECSEAEVFKIVVQMQEEGKLITILSNGRLAITNSPSPSYEVVEEEIWNGETHIRVGLVSDTHLCSKDQQLTFLNEVYDKFQAKGIKTVYHCGDITEGYGMWREQQFEVFKHGADEFIDYLVENYPKRNGITTKFISGNHDHSFIKTAGIDICTTIGRLREDMIYLGRSYAKIQLTKNCRMDLVHPIDGSSYAVSYAIQKFIEALPEYDLPDILLSGHHHKYVTTFYRGIYAVEVPCTQARTDWERGKRININVGAMILDITVDKDGFISSFVPELIPCKNIIHHDY